MRHDLNESVGLIRTLLGLSPEVTDEARQFITETLPHLAGNSAWEFFGLVADICEVRHGERGIAVALDGIPDLIKACCVIGDIDIVQELWLQEQLNRLKKATRQSSTYEELLSRAPHKSDNVLIYYLANTRKGMTETGDGGDGRERWKRLCYLGYCGTRMGLISSIATQALDMKGERYGTVDHQAMDSARAIEVLIKYVPLDHLSGYISTTVEPALIDYTIAKIAREAEGLKSEDTVKRYSNWAKSLLSKEVLVRRRRASDKNRLSQIVLAHSPLAISEIPSPNEAISETKERAFRSGQDDYEDYSGSIEKIDIEEGGTNHEYPEAPSPADLLSLRSGLRERYLLYRALGWTPVWAASVLPQEALGTLIAWIINHTPVENMSALQLGRLCFVVTQVHFGFCGDLLAGTRIYSSNNQPADGLRPLAYDSECAAFEIHPRSHDGKPLFATAGFHAEAPYLSGAHSFKLHVPLLVKVLLNRFIASVPRSDDRLFAFTDADGQQTVLDRYTMDSYLKQAKLILSERVDTNRIGRSAVLHLNIYGAVDPLLTAFISGFAPRHLAAQTHYTNLPVKDLEARYLPAIESVYIRLRQVSQAQIEAFGFADLDCLDNLCRLENPTTRSMAGSEERRFGSPFVPQVEEVRSYFYCLRELLTKEADPYVWFNRYTVYSTLALMAVTGLRPVEVELLTSNRVGTVGKKSEAIICARSKANKEFDEWRVVFLSEPVGTILAAYQTEVARILKWRRQEGDSIVQLEQERKQAFFFFLLGQRRRLVPFTTEVFRNLARAGEGGELSIPAFRWKLNSLRHLYCSKCLEKGFARRVIDALMGHQTRGREPLGRYSLALNADIRQASRQIAEEIVRLLAIDVPVAGAQR